MFKISHISEVKGYIYFGGKHLRPMQILYITLIFHEVFEGPSHESVVFIFPVFALVSRVQLPWLTSPEGWRHLKSPQIIILKWTFVNISRTKLMHSIDSFKTTTSFLPRCPQLSSHPSVLLLRFCNNIILTNSLLTGIIHLTTAFSTIRKIIVPLE